MATRSSIPSALHAQLYATTSSNDNQLIVLRVNVDGATNNFVRVKSLKIFPLDIDWLNRTVKPRDIDFNAVLVVITDSASTWKHVAVVDSSSTTTNTREACDGSSLAVCNTATPRHAPPQSNSDS